MNRVQNHITLSITPEGIRALCASSRDGNTYTVKCQKEILAADTSTRLKDRKEEIIALLRETIEGSPRHSAGAIALHPVYTICRLVTIPNAPAKDVRAFLDLWIQRQWPPVRHGAMRWAWVNTLTQSDNKKALVLIAREEDVILLEEAMREAGIRPLFITTSPIAQAWLLKSRVAKGKTILLSVEKSGAGMTVLGDGEAEELRWFPLDEAQETAARLALCDFHLREELEDSENTRLLLHGSYAHEARTALETLRHAEELSWAESVRQLSPALSDQAMQSDEAALFGLLPLLNGKRESASNLCQAPIKGQAVLDKLRPLTRGRRAVALIAMLTALVIGIFVAGKLLESSFQAQAEEAISRFDMDVYAAQQNIGILEELEDERQVIAETLLALHELKPDGAVFESFQLNSRGNATLTGTTDSYSSVEEFAAAISDHPQFTTAINQQMTREEKKVNFSIRFSPRGTR